MNHKGKKIDITSVSNKDSLFFASADIEGDHLIEAGSRTVAVVALQTPYLKQKNSRRRDI